MYPIGSVGSVVSGQTAGSSSSAGVMGKEDFLKLLVAQLTYQDPLNPMQNQEFATQLAQFSSLEQLQNVNANLQASIAGTGLLNRSMNGALAATLLGKDITASNQSIVLTSGESVTAGFELGTDAHQMVAQIRNADGQPVRILQLGANDAGSGHFSWDGRDHQGNLLPGGAYTYSLMAMDREGRPVAVASSLRGKATAVRYEGDEVFLLVKGIKVALSDVIEAVEP